MNEKLPPCEQITLFPVETLPDRPTAKPPEERVKDPGCFFVRARWRDVGFKLVGHGLTFTTLDSVRRYADGLHVGWNNRRIYHIAEDEV